jgi:hypothetical protein
MNVKTQSSSRRRSRKPPMRLLIEIRDGCLYSLAVTGPCEVAIVDHDVKETLPEGDLSYTCTWSPDIDSEAVEDAFRLADPSRPPGVAGRP